MTKNCTLCNLHKTRTNIVFGIGPMNAKVMFVGEAPGAKEDEQGKPFVGKAGKLLTKIIEEEGLRRSDVYITNVVRCRPPKNRRPKLEEISVCSRFLFKTISDVQPRIICALGLTSAHLLSGKKDAIADLRRIFHPYINDQQIQVKSTYHPAYLSRKPSAENLFRADIRAIIKKLKD